MNKKNIILILVALVVVLVGGYFAIDALTGSEGSTTMEETNDFVAMVNGEGILKSDFNTQFASALASLQSQGVDTTSAEFLAQLNTQVLDDLINTKLVEQGIKASGLSATQEEVDAEVASVTTQLGGEEALSTQLANNNLTMEQFLSNITNQLTIQKYLRSNIDSSSVEVTEEEIVALYEQATTAQQQEVPPLEDVRDQVEQQIRADKEQALVNAFIAELRADADIEIIETTEDEMEAGDAMEEETEG